MYSCSKSKIIFLLLVVSSLLSACVGSRQPDSGSRATGVARPISDGDLKYMPLEQQYQVLNKLLNTLYKGLPVDSFFELNKGLMPLKKKPIDHIENIWQAIHRDSVNYAAVESMIDQKYTFSTRSLGRAKPLAMIHELPLSKEFYYHWMAYRLANSILFSPAYELDTVGAADVEAVYHRLFQGMKARKSIRQIVYEHLISQENWRRFRSPEDNTREMMEIFLVYFNDAEVPLAAKACQNWSLSRANDLVIDSENPNTEPVSVLGRNGIVSCEDFYRAVAEHPMLIFAMTHRIVDHIFYGYDSLKKAQFINQLMQIDPVHFDDIFDVVVFSYEYLTKMSREKTYEETMLGNGGRMDWYAHGRFFHSLNDDNTSSGPPDLANMNQHSMSHKLGRPWKTFHFFDSLSLAYYHNSIRDSLYLDRRIGSPTDMLDATGDGGWRERLVTKDLVTNLSDEEYFQYIFLASVGRLPTGNETLVLSNEIATESNRINKAYIVFDYASRLSETYFMSSFLEEGAQ
ncbi:MAG: hypothetical protein OEZ58_15110 [Gammaproteobacteria bacterium]|nr:hypothetical protein [Gammaproteobacteria bacterium]MDH5730324.1 hypothetical protein [Gammaproteobacteria bacterium]